jgi:hypothetical protein
MRVLHVIDAGHPLLREFARPRLEDTFDDRVLACRELVVRSPRSYDHRVGILGGAHAVARAASLGLPIDLVVPPLLGEVHLAVGPVGKVVRAVRPDIVHWWNRRWTGGCFGRPGRAWRLESILGSTPLKVPLWLSHGGALVCGPAERMAANGADLQPFDIPPPAFAGTPIAAECDEPPRVLLLGPNADARHFLFMCGLIWGSGMKLTAVVAANAAGHARTRRVGRTFQYPVRVIISNNPRAELLAKCAAAVWMGPARPDTASPAASIQSALAAGVPVAVPVEVEWAIPASLRPRLVGKNSTPNDLARMLIGILSDPPVLNDHGRSEAANVAFTHAALRAYEGRAMAVAPADAPPSRAQSPAA